MLRIVEESIRAVTPHVLGVDAEMELPEADPQQSVDFMREWTDVGIPEFGAVTSLAFLLLNVYSLVRKRRMFHRLDREAQAELMHRLFRAKGVPMFALLYFIANPAVSAYYSRVDVQVALGFDIPALIEESRSRLVTRDGPPPPPRDIGQNAPEGKDIP